MKAMVPLDRMSKKARAAIVRQKRTVWTVNPVTRIRPSGKTYNRRRDRRCPEI